MDFCLEQQWALVEIPNVSRKMGKVLGQSMTSRCHLLYQELSLAASRSRSCCNNVQWLEHCKEQMCDEVVVWCLLFQCQAWWNWMVSFWLTGIWHPHQAGHQLKIGWLTVCLPEIFWTICNLSNETSIKQTNEIRRI